MRFCSLLVCFFFFNDTATTEIYTLSLHDALPTSTSACAIGPSPCMWTSFGGTMASRKISNVPRSEEHTSELQSRPHLVCRLLLEKKKEIQLRPHLVCRLLILNKKI